MVFIVLLSLILNALFMIKFYQNKKFNQRITNQLKWIKQGDALAELRKHHSSVSQDLLIEEINDLIKRHKQIQIEFNTIDNQNKEMISSISHDFRTPLTSMLGYVQILQASAESEKEIKYLKIVEERTKVLSELVEEFYRLSLLESKDLSFEMEQAYPILLLQEQLALYHQELSQSFSTVSVQLMEETISIETSVLEFNRLLGNLIKNAFSHGTERFCVYNELSKDSLMIYIENKVEKTDALDVNKLFDRTYKGDKPRTSSSTGLGLSIAKKIAESLGYTLEAAIEGEILQFKLSIPLNERK
ncbi:HAMP domain-containing sensor histidine kinase [Marinilactibacillus sp. XAAS-LB27]|uniref:sensor histidine kinase n=1 Tax=Marinilactibacillus sp. XAAS-LB27 TaxID=3114538 RepID=UPI002E19D712|nr:HAMP domain-containing sensor histidine kinase [Marinilactibacillus sp. XAAS-LB27]